MTGTVIGEPMENGFFVRSKYDRVIFVESSAEVSRGETVSVAGVLEAASTVGFDRWEANAFVSDELAADWDVLSLFYLDDDAVPNPDA